MEKAPALDGRLFVVVTCNDGIEYQVKLNVKDNKSNHNEFISNVVGREIGASVPNGKWIQFSKRQIDGLCVKFNLINTECFSKMLYFGVEWYDETYTPQCDEDVPFLVNECKNKKSFFAVFPYDQFLRNHDRVFHNHMAIKKEGESKPSHYLSIDGDRIFGCTTWSRLDVEKNNFNCFNYDFYQKLYDLVDDSSFTDVFKFAVSVSLVEVSKIIELMNENYDDIKQEHDKIKEFLEFRKGELWQRCTGSCFKNVKNQTLRADKK